MVEEDRDAIKFYGKVAKMPKGAKAGDSINFLEKIKISKQKLWYIIIEKEEFNELQTIKYNTNDLFDETFANCEFVRSYITGKNKDVEDTDNDYGDIVIADFNFDGKDDIALTNATGGNGGPLYNFYLQNNQGKFVLDNYLTDTMEFFPNEINKNKKTLVTLVHASAVDLCESTYKYNSVNRKWKEIKRRLVPY